MPLQRFLLCKNSLSNEIQFGNNGGMLKILIAICFALVGLHTLAQTPADASVQSPQTSRQISSETGALVLFSRPIFTFRAPNQGISAVDRAKRAHSRIQEQLQQPGVHRVSLFADTGGIQVRIDGTASFIITPSDLDPSRDEGIDQAANQVAAALTLAIQESLESRSLDTLLKALGKSLLATILFSIVIWLAKHGRRKLTRRLESVTTEHSQKLHLGGMTLLHRDRASRAVQMVTTFLYHLLVLLLTVEWLSFVLQSFPFTRAWGESLNGFLIELGKPLLSAAIASVPELLTAALIFYLGFLVTKGLDRFFERVQAGEAQIDWLDADVAAPTRRIGKVVVWLFCLAMAYPYLPGSDTEAFKGLSVLVGLMLSMGASSLVGQAASGLILTYGRAFRKGDFVRIADNEGTVTEMGIFTTRIRTGLGEELTVSNASILSNTTRNYSRSVKGAGFILDTTVSIGYDTPWRQVHAMLQEAARRTSGIRQEPQPIVFQTELSDWYPVYRLVCQATPEGPAPRAMLLSNLHANIQDVFNEHGVAIMSPHYMSDPEHPKTVAPSRWFAPPAMRQSPDPE